MHKIDTALQTRAMETEMDELARAAQRVKKQLDAAREIAWEAFHEPSEETVMAIFHRLCVERDLLPPAEEAVSSVTVH